MRNRKRLPVLLALAVLLGSMLSGCFLGDVALLYGESEIVDGCYFEINKLANCCFVSRCDEPEDGILTIPDTFNGIPVTRLGGFVGSGAPCPFFISLENRMNARKDSELDFVLGYHPDEWNSNTWEYTVEDVAFVLNLGKNIEKIELTLQGEYWPHLNEDGTVTFYHPVVEVHCDPENRHFYSEDGKLYYKDTGLLVEELDYPDVEGGTP